MQRKYLMARCLVDKREREREIIIDVSRFVSLNIVSGKIRHVPRDANTVHVGLTEICLDRMPKILTRVLIWNRLDSRFVIPKSWMTEMGVEERKLPLERFFSTEVERIGSLTQSFELEGSRLRAVS